MIRCLACGHVARDWAGHVDHLETAAHADLPEAYWGVRA
jgi:DNA-directed RNA polymerase subunit N (RpoN/RPB10)